MWGKLLSRLAEPSSWAGLAAVVAGVGQLGKIEEAPAIVDVIGQAGQAVGANGPFGGLVALGLGLVAVFVGEKGPRDGR